MVAKKIGFLDPLFIVNRCFRCVMLAVTSFVWGSVSPVPFFFPVGDQNDRLKCLVFSRVENKLVRYSPLGFLLWGVFVLSSS